SKRYVLSLATTPLEDITINDQRGISAEHEFAAITELKLAKTCHIGAQPLVSINRVRSRNNSLANRTLTADSLLGVNGPTNSFGRQSAVGRENKSRCNDRDVLN